MALKIFGKSKAASSKADTVSQQSTIPPNSWVCKKCGAINPNSVLSCKDCGAYK